MSQQASRTPYVPSFMRKRQDEQEQQQNEQKENDATSKMSAVHDIDPSAPFTGDLQRWDVINYVLLEMLPCDRDVVAAVGAVSQAWHSMTYCVRPWMENCSTKDYDDDQDDQASNTTTAVASQQRLFVCPCQSHARLLVHLSRGTDHVIPKMTVSSLPSQAIAQLRRSFVNFLLPLIKSDNAVVSELLMSDDPNSMSFLQCGDVAHRIDSINLRVNDASTRNISFIGGCKNLRHLKVEICTTSDVHVRYLSLTPVGALSLAGIERVERGLLTLFIHSFVIVDLTPLASNPSRSTLQTLTLADVSEWFDWEEQHSRVLKHLANNLTTFRVLNSRMTRYRSISELYRVTTLVLSMCNLDVAQLESVGKMESLTYLSLRSVTVFDRSTAPRDHWLLGKLAPLLSTRLRVLNLDQIFELKDADVVHYIAYPLLHQKGRNEGKCCALRELSMKGCDQITVAGYYAIAALPSSLEKIYWSVNQSFSDSDIDTKMINVVAAIQEATELIGQTLDKNNKADITNPSIQRLELSNRYEVRGKTALFLPLVLNFPALRALHLQVSVSAETMAALGNSPLLEDVSLIVDPWSSSSSSGGGSSGGGGEGGNTLGLFLTSGQFLRRLELVHLPASLQPRLSATLLTCASSLEELVLTRSDLTDLSVLGTTTTQGNPLFTSLHTLDVRHQRQLASMEFVLQVPTLRTCLVQSTHFWEHEMPSLLRQQQKSQQGCCHVNRIVSRFRVLRRTDAFSFSFGSDKSSGRSKGWRNDYENGDNGATEINPWDTMWRTNDGDAALYGMRGAEPAGDGQMRNNDF